MTAVFMRANHPCFVPIPSDWEAKEGASELESEQRGFID
jgi:hypothetical protein